MGFPQAISDWERLQMLFNIRTQLILAIEQAFVTFESKLSVVGICRVMMSILLESLFR